MVQTTASQPSLAIENSQVAQTTVLSVLPEGLYRQQPTWDRFPDGSWWREYSTTLLPHDVAVCMEWTPEALFQYIP